MNREQLNAYLQHLIEQEVVVPIPLSFSPIPESWEWKDAHSMTFQNMTEEAEKEMEEWRGILDGKRKGRNDAG